jgi:hypothetical protein
LLTLAGAKTRTVGGIVSNRVLTRALLSRRQRPGEHLEISGSRDLAISRSSDRQVARSSDSRPWGLQSPERSNQETP